MTTRVLQIIPTLDRNGAEKQLCYLSKGLPRDRFEVHVCLLTRSGPLISELEEAEIPVTQINKSWKVDPLALSRLTKHVRSLAPDVVHTWIFAANSYGRLAAMRAGVRHIVAGERCVDPWKAWHELTIDRYFARHTDRIVTNSKGVVEFYSRHGIPTEKFEVIPNGIEPPDGTNQTGRDKLLGQLGLPANARLIGAIGRLWPQKRVKDLIFATDLLKCIRDDVHLLIVGDGPQRWRLERFRDQCRLRGNVHFLGYRDDVQEMLPYFDCVWLGSGYEGQSNAVMEAMSAGVPVVATDIPGNRELIVVNETGYLVPIGDRAAFARWTSVLLDDDTLRRQLGDAGRDRMFNVFSVEQMVQRYVELYDSLTS